VKKNAGMPAKKTRLTTRPTRKLWLPNSVMSTRGLALAAVLRRCTATKAHRTGTAATTMATSQTGQPFSRPSVKG